MTTKTKTLNITIYGIDASSMVFSAKDLGDFTVEIQSFLNGWGIDAGIEVEFRTTLNAFIETEDEENDDE